MSYPQSDDDINDSDDITVDFEKSPRCIAEEKYLKTCNLLGIRPVTSYINNLSNSELRIPYRGIGYKSMQGIASSLRHNIWIRKVDFTDNNLGVKGARSIASMLQHNNCILSLNLSCNQLGLEGFICITEPLKHKSILKYLNLSNNRLPDQIADSLNLFVCSNKSLIELDISKNKLSVECGKRLKDALEKNVILETFDLSWNEIRREGALEVARGLARNRSLKKVNLSYNGFSDQGAEALGRSLLSNLHLLEIDLSSNRVSNIGAKYLAKAVKVNETLKILKLGWNPMGTEGIDAVLHGCYDNTKRSMQELHFNSLYVNHETTVLMDKLMAKIPGLKVIVGGFTKGKNTTDNKEQLQKELIHILKSYLFKHRLRMVDLFNQWDKDKSFSITREEFRNGVKSCKIPLSDSQLNILIEWLDNDQSNSIEYSEFVGITEIE